MKARPSLAIHVLNWMSKISDLFSLLDYAVISIFLCAMLMLQLSCPNAYFYSVNFANQLDIYTQQGKLAFSLWVISQLRIRSARNSYASIILSRLTCFAISCLDFASFSRKKKSNRYRYQVIKKFLFFSHKTNMYPKSDWGKRNKGTAQVAEMLKRLPGLPLERQFGIWFRVGSNDQTD